MSNQIQPNYDKYSQTIKKYAEIIGRTFVKRSGGYDEYNDLTQQYYTLYYDPSIIKKAIDNKGNIETKLAHFLVKRRLLSFMQSRVWNYSYRDIVEHASLTTLPEVDKEKKFASHIYVDKDAITNVTLEKLLSKLNDRQREAVTLTKIYSFTQEEAAVKMLCSRSMVSKYTTQAMKIMQSYI